MPQVNPNTREGRVRRAMKDLNVGQFVLIPDSELHFIRHAVMLAKRHGKRFEVRQDVTGRLAVVRIS